MIYRIFAMRAFSGMWRLCIQSMDRSVNLTTSFNQTNGSTRRKTMFDKFSVNGLKAINVSIHPICMHLCAYERPVLYKRFCTVICVAINAPTKNR